MNIKNHKMDNRGLTLVELLVVIAILAILALITVLYTRLRKKALSPILLIVI